jgi:hypothetical protein
MASAIAGSGGTVVRNNTNRKIIRERQVEVGSRLTPKTSYMDADIDVAWLRSMM